jgi:hypothetical protein
MAHYFFFGHGIGGFRATLLCKSVQRSYIPDGIRLTGQQIIKGHPEDTGKRHKRIHRRLSPALLIHSHRAWTDVQPSCQLCLAQSTTLPQRRNTHPQHKEIPRFLSFFRLFYHGLFAKGGESCRNNMCIWEKYTFLPEGFLPKNRLPLLFFSLWEVIISEEMQKEVILWL